MKLLVIIIGLNFGEEHKNNIQILDNYMKQSGANIEYCGISSHNDFYVFEDIIEFKYKIINNKLQLSKICDFITEYKEKLDHDWYIKIRPDIKLLDNISFDILSKDAINGRARVYRGRKRIKYGTSVHGEGCWKLINDSHYVDCEDDIILDDMLYIFHKNVIQNGAFTKIPQMPPDIREHEWFRDTREHERFRDTREHEWFHFYVFSNRNIKMNVIGINLCNTQYETYSGDINM
jgi:hypothetical protein